jgi:hypothetical protein
MSTARRLAIAFAVAAASLVAPTAIAKPPTSKAPANVAASAKRATRVDVGATRKARSTRKTKAVHTTATGSVECDTSGGLGELASLAREPLDFELGGRSRVRGEFGRESEVFAEQRLADAQVKKVIRGHSDEIDVCYSRALIRGAAPRGEASAKFVIEPRGTTSKVRVRAAGPNARRLERCMVGAIKRWKFPAADAATEVAYPFVFDVAGSTLDADADGE